MALTRLKAQKYLRPLRVVLYVRVSRDKTGAAISVKRQRKELKAFCRAMKWKIVRIFEDNDVSASHISVAERTEYQSMMKFLAAAEVPVDVLAATANTRATRDLEEYLDIRKLCISHGLYYAYNNDVFDMTDTDDRHRSAVDAANAEREVSQNRDNLLSGKEIRAKQGYPTGRLLDGYRRIRDKRGGFKAQVVDEERGPVIAEALERMYRGTTEHTIAAEWNEAGFLTPLGCRWDAKLVIKKALNPAYAGLAVWRGEICGKGRWPALIKPRKWRALQARLTSPDRSTGSPRTVQNLLTGAITAPCGGGVRAQKNRQTRHYSCKLDYCTQVNLARADDFVKELLFARFRRPDALEILVPVVDEAAHDEAAASLAELERRVELAQDAGVAGEVSHAYVAKVEKKLGPKIEKLRAQLAATKPPTIPEPIRRLASPDPAAVWERMDLLVQREIVRMLLDIRLKKRTIMDRGWHPEDRFDITWKQLP